MSEMTNLNVRVDKEEKKEFEELCAAIGINLTTAINIFIKKSLREYRIPFELDADRPNKETLEAFAESEMIKADPTLRKRYKNVDDMMEDILADV